MSRKIAIADNYTAKNPIIRDDYSFGNLVANFESFL